MARPARIFDVGKQQLLNDIAGLFMNEDYSDAILIVEGRRLPVVRSVLAVRNDFFRALFFGPLTEKTQDTFELPEAQMNGFLPLLQTIYTGKLELTACDTVSVLEVLNLAQRFCFPPAVSDLAAETLITRLDTTNAINVFEGTRLLDRCNLRDECLKFMDRNADKLIKDVTFASAELATLKELLQRDSFVAEESEIFNALHLWIERNQGEGHHFDRDEIIGLARLPLMVGLVNTNPGPATEGRLEGHWDLVDDVSYRIRGLEVYDMDLLKCDFVEALFKEGVPFKYSMYGVENRVSRRRSNCEGWAFHEADKEIVLQLGKPAKLNHFGLLLPLLKPTIDDDLRPEWQMTLPLEMRMFEYTIEVSLNGVDWSIVVRCQSKPYQEQPRNYNRPISPVAWHDWYFKPVIVRYVRVKGTRFGADDSKFYVLSFSCSLSSKKFDVRDDGILVPQFNCAEMPYDPFLSNPQLYFRSACSIHDKYDAYTQNITLHHSRDGDLLVNLNQAAVLSSMQFTLWDRDTRSYGFIVKVSPDNGDQWTVISDHRDERCRGCRIVEFSSQVVKKIRIVCTNVFPPDPRKEDFRVVSFSCPAVADCLS